MCNLVKTNGVKNCDALFVYEGLKRTNYSPMNSNIKIKNSHIFFNKF